MRILVLGGGGQVARAVAAAAPAHHAVTVATRAEVDIADEQAVRTTLGAGFDWVVNGAAYTAVDLAEKEVDQATRINDVAVGVLARAAREARCRLLHLSTDFVFDGQSNRAYLPTDTVAPLSAYGITKHGGEARILEDGADAIIVRTAWVYAATGRNFALTMLRLMREREEVRVVSDQIGTPTWSTGLAHALWGIIEAAAPGGIYHWTDLGVASWYDFAVAIQEEALLRGLLTRAVPVVPIATAAYPTPARRPPFSVLDTESTRAIVPGLARHWRHNLRMMLNELRAA